ncbi:MAG: restriction endonuclease subunit S [Bacteroidales bacterium]|nr:restriction endonuclease subunit S [Bacteroidales bacterium]
MREGWQIRKLGDVCSVRRDSSIHTGMNYVGLEHISSGNGVLVSLADTSGVIGTTNLFNAGDVLYGKLRPYLKKVIVADCDGCCSTEILPIRCNGVILPDFLKYWFLEDGITDKINATCGGCRMPRANMKDVFQFAFAFPSLPEQQRIVDILDQEFAKIDALKANAEKSLQAAKDLFQATLKKELEPKEGWKTQMIGQICIIKSGNSNANNSPSGSLPFVKVGDMNIEGNEVFITCSSRYVDYESNKKGVFPVGSVIFPKRGGAILTNKKRLTATEICCDLNIMGVFPKYDILTPEYLFAFFQGVDMASIYDGAAIPQINNGDISPLRISFPNVQTQKCIVSRLEDLNDKSITLQQNYQKTLTLCDDLKQSLLRKAFIGEL